MKKKLISAFLCVSMVAVMMSGCGSGDSTTDDASKTSGDAGVSSEAGEDVAAEDEAASETEVTNGDGSSTETAVVGDASAEDAFVVWGWNDDIKKIIEGVYEKAYPDDASRIVFVNSGGSDYYQTKIDEILEQPDSELYPDLMGLEVDYILKYVNSDYLMSLEDTGVTDADMANQYQYNRDLATSQVDGKQKASFWQATPGSIQLKANLCEKYLGTTDQAELQKIFSSWDSILDAAKTVNEASGGKVKLFSGYDECFRIMSNNKNATSWYDDSDNIQVGDTMLQYMDYAKSLCDDELTYQTDQWSPDWYAIMGGDGEANNAALAFCGCPWFTYWCLDDSWKGNTILVNAPEQFYWGGSALAATANCADPELAGRIIKCLTCDTDSMVAINALNSDFVNNTEAISKISENGATCDYLYDSTFDIIGFYLPLAEEISASNVRAEDQNINSAWATQVKEYANGNKDKDTAVADFKAAVHDSFSYLNIGE